MRKNTFIKTNILFFLIISILISSCSTSSENKINKKNEAQNSKVVGHTALDVNFSIDNNKEEVDIKIVEDKSVAKALGKEHSTKYYTYLPQTSEEGNFTYVDALGQKHNMTIDENVEKNDYVWSQGSVATKFPPDNVTMTYGIDISRHNGKIDFKKVKDAGFDFVIIRVIYRGYGKRGSLNVDENAIANIKSAKEAGLKIGAYVFSQALNAKEAIDEATEAVKVLKEALGEEELDLPLFYDPENIREAVSRVDNLSGEQWTKNTIAFCDYVKAMGYQPAFYSNMVFEHNYFDLTKLKDYEIWYADYEEYPQTPYRFNYWQFSERGIVDGVEGLVDLNVRLIKK